jgi:hypothetical protein
MGLCCSCFSFLDDGERGLEEQYKTLVVTKPTPISLEHVELEYSSGSEVPLFARISSDGDEMAKQEILNAHSQKQK